SPRRPRAPAPPQASRPPAPPPPPLCSIPAVCSSPILSLRTHVRHITYKCTCQQENLVYCLPVFSIIDAHMTDVTTAPVPTPTLSEHSVRTIDVKREYPMGAETVHALRGVTISINRGEYISIMGPSGSGKSTLFNMIGGLDKPTSGKIYIDEVDIA